MAEKSSARFHLADLIAVVLICGVLAAMISSGRGFGRSEVLLRVLGLVIVGWVVVRTRRNASTCDECGRRFSPQKKPDPAIRCPHCGERQGALARSLRVREVLFWAMTPVIGISAFVIMILATYASSAGEPLEGTRLAGVLIAAGVAVVAFLSMIRLRASRSRR